jgi:hypothetical protein
MINQMGFVPPQFARTKQEEVKQVEEEDDTLEQLNSQLHSLLGK